MASPLAQLQPSFISVLPPRTAPCSNLLIVQKGRYLYLLILYSSSSLFLEEIRERWRINVVNRQNKICLRQENEE